MELTISAVEVDEAQDIGCAALGRSVEPAAGDVRGLTVLDCSRHRGGQG